MIFKAVWLSEYRRLNEPWLVLTALFSFHHLPIYRKRSQKQSSAEMKNNSEMVVSIGLTELVLKSSRLDRLTMPVNEWLLLNLSDLPINKGETEGSGEMWHMVLSSPLYFRSKIALGTVSPATARPVVLAVSELLTLHCCSRPRGSSALQVPPLQNWCFPR